MPGSAFSQDFEETGKCSYYADKFQGRNTTGGEKYNKWAYTGAHRTLPFGTKVEVTNLSNNKKVVVRINDRGPAARSRIIDISRVAAEDLGIIPMGVVRVSIRVTDAPVPAPKKHEEPAIVAGNNTPAAPKTKAITYDHDMNVCSPGGYGIAAGYYQNPENCRKALSGYEEKYKAPGFIAEIIKKGSSSYILILGCMAHRKDAVALLQRIKIDLPTAHIIAFDSL